MIITYEKFKKVKDRGDDEFLNSINDLVLVINSLSSTLSGLKRKIDSLDVQVGE